MAADDAVYEVVSIWTTPVATTDYTANDQSDGAGNDLTSDVGISVTKTSEVMIITVTNNHATSDMYLTLLKARGQPLKLDNPVLVFAEDATSQAKYGKRQFSVPAELVRDTVEGADHVNWLLSIYKDPRPQLDITVIGNVDDAHMTQVLARDISDSIIIDADGSNTDLGITGQNMFIESIRGLIDQNHVSSRVFSCSTLDTVSHFWGLNRSELAISTGLHY